MFDMFDGSVRVSHLDCRLQHILGEEMPTSTVRVTHSVLRLQGAFQNRGYHFLDTLENASENRHT